MPSADIVSSFDGFIDGRHLYGWVVDRNNRGDNTLKVALEIDGRIRAQTIASSKRGDGFHGFGIHLEQPLEPIYLLNGRARLVVCIHEGEPVELSFYPPTRVRIEILMIEQALSAIRSADALAAAYKRLMTGPNGDVRTIATVTTPTGSVRVEDISLLGSRAGTACADDTAIIGHGGQLFIHRGSNDLRAMYDMPEDLPYLVETARVWADIIDRRSSRMQALGIGFIQIIIPDKSSVYPGLYPFPIQSPTPLLKAIESKTTSSSYVSVVNLLRSVPAHEKPYLSTDSHLSDLGSREVVRGVVARMRENLADTPELSAASALMEDDTLVAGERIVAGDLGHRFFGVWLYETCRTVSAEGMAKLGTGVVEKEMWMPEDGRHYGMRCVWSNPNAPIRMKVVAFGNSYFERGAAPSGLSWWFKHLFSEFHFVWSATLGQDYVLEVKPDLVVCQSVERFLGSVPTD